MSPLLAGEQTPRPNTGNNNMENKQKQNSCDVLMFGHMSVGPFIFISATKYSYGRQSNIVMDDDDGSGGAATFSFGGVTVTNIGEKSSLVVTNSVSICFCVYHLHVSIF